MVIAENGNVILESQDWAASLGFKLMSKKDSNAAKIDMQTSSSPKKNWINLTYPNFSLMMDSWQSRVCDIIDWLMLQKTSEDYEMKSIWGETNVLLLNVGGTTQYKVVERCRN